MGEKPERDNAALIDSEERYRSLVEAIPFGVTLTDLESKVVMVNKAAIEMYGAESENEMIGISALDMIAPEDHERALANMQLTLEQGSIKNIEYTLRRKDGSTYPAEISAAPILDSEGKPRAFSGIIRDITEIKKSGKALRESEERYRLLYENLSDGLLLLDLEGTIGMCSPRCAELFGFTPEEVVGENYLKFIHPEDRDTILTAFKEGIANQEAASAGYEIRGIRKDEVVFYFHVTNKLIIDDGKPAGYQGLIRDITARKLAEKALQESEAKYKALAEQSLQGLAIMQDEGIAYANPAFSEITGYTLDELLEMTTQEIWGYIHPDDHERLRNRFQEYMTMKEVQPPIEYRIVRKDGGIRWVESYVSIIDFKGTPAMQSAVIDITEKKRAQEEILKSEIQYRTLAEQSLQGLTILTDEGLVYANPAFLKMVGYSEEELLQMSIEEVWNLFHSEDQVILRERIKSRMKGAKLPGRQEYRLIRKDGDIRWVETFASKVDFAGLPAIQTVHIDITERRQAEKEVRSAKDRAMLYLDLMGHDLRNQLQVIQNTAELLWSATDDSVKESFYEIIRDSVQRCSRMIDEAKITEQLLIVPLTKRSLNMALMGCIEALTTRISDEIFQLNFEIPDAEVNADEYLELLLSNILMNAIEHNPNEDKHVWVDLKTCEDGYIISISDNGPGIPDSRKQMIFDTSRRFGGLGLHQSWAIVEKYGGKIEIRDRVEGEPDKGSQIWIWFPKQV
jgi:PAS domain S-box-containing protein